jgi:hypothetical protein
MIDLKSLPIISELITARSTTCGKMKTKALDLKSQIYITARSTTCGKRENKVTICLKGRTNE